MSESTLRIRSDVPLSEAFADINPATRTYLRSAFATLAGLPAEQADAVSRTMLHNLEAPQEVGESALRAVLPLDDRNTRKVGAAAMFLIVSASGRTESAASVIGALSTAEILDPQSAAGVLSFAEKLLSQEPAIAERLEKLELGSVVLPSLRSFSSAVDVRLQFEGGRVKTALPVAVLQFDTDSEGQILWLQMTRPEIEQLVRDLQQLVDRMRGAEQWLPK